MNTSLRIGWIVPLLLLGYGTLHADDELEFRAKLLGDNEVPPVETETDGKAQVEFSEDDDSLEFKLRVNDGRRVTQAHIHCAPEGVNGPIVVFLAGFHDLGWDVDGNWVRNTTATDANVLPTSPFISTCPNTIDNIADLLNAARDGNTYVNVHTVDNPGGEIRGQLELDNDDD